MDRDGVEEAIGRAIGFIRSAQGADGLWRDFETLAGSSSDWVSGFVLRALSSSPCPEGVKAPAVRSLVSRQRENGGWSYNRVVPTDCDSTSWVLLAVSPCLQPGSSEIRKGLRYLRLHQDQVTGGFATYRPWDRIQEFIGVAATDSMAGWFCTHGCVTSVAVQSLIEAGVPTGDASIQKASGYILAGRNSRGLWDSYWWKGYAYGTWEALKALSLSRSLTAEIGEKAARSLLQDQNEDGGWNDWSGEGSEVFATALVISSLLLLQDRGASTAVERGIEWLVSRQNRDGSFPPAPMLKIPPPMAKDPSMVRDWRTNGMGTGVVIEDKGRVFTTSAAISAMRAFKDGGWI